METVNASIVWDGPERDQIILLADPPMPYDVRILDDDLILYVGVDREDKTTGQVVGVEVLDFLSFNRWGELPDDGQAWKLASAEPVPLSDLLKGLQEDLAHEDRP